MNRFAKDRKILDRHSFNIMLLIIALKPGIRHKPWNPGTSYNLDIPENDIPNTAHPGIPVPVRRRDPDIKELLLDYLPNFIDTLDKIGRCVILLCLRKDELEDFYGRDKYAQLLGSCRKLLKLLGDTVEHLQRYTSMK